MSVLDAAARVLKEAGEVMNCKAMTERMVSAGYWKTQGKTPAATLRSDRLQVEVKTFRGFPAEAILRETEFIKADLIAIGTFGRSGLNRFFMGSVAQRVLHQAQCPVLTVRKPDSADPIRLSAT